MKFTSLALVLTGVRALAGSLVLAAVLALAGGCRKVSTEVAVEGEPITFYIKTQQHTKNIIDNTAALISQGPSIYVTDNATNPAFTNTKIDHTGNGLWRSQVSWNSAKSYTLYAYVASQGTASTLNVSSNGRGVTVAQPQTYQEDDAAYSDYLLSWSVTADGSNPSLVYLNLERVTTAVELYVSMSSKMTSVKLTSACFRNINRSATFTISSPAASTDPAQYYGMKHNWQYTRTNETVDYTYTAPTGGLSIEKAESDTEFNYDEKYRVMNFMTVQQPTYEEVSGGVRQVQLVLNYTVQENGSDIAYEAEFNLNEYATPTWYRGHKIRYYISIDSSIELTGTVSRWEEVDFIEGTLLPN